jgi:alcohol dehydrogenase
METRGAVLERLGDPRPYASSRPITISAVDLDDPGPREILVQIEVAGICHSDLSVVEGNRPRPVPMLLGHEASGTVLRTGADVAQVTVGQRVVMTFLPRCGVCEGCATEGRRPCVPGTKANEAGTLLEGGFRLSRAGERLHHHLGVSGFATHAVVDERSVVPVGEDVPADVAALLGCAVLTGGGAVLNVAPPRAGQTVAVVGLGGVGMAALLTALATDNTQVVGVDVSDAKLRTATDLGAHQVMNAAIAAQEGLPADLVVEAAGNVPAFETAVRVTGPGGTMVTVGLPPAQATAAVSPTWLVGGGRRIVGSYLGSAVPSRDIPRFADLWRAGKLPLEALVSAHITLDEVNHGMDRLADGAELRQLIDLRG